MNRDTLLLPKRTNNLCDFVRQYHSRKLCSIPVSYRTKQASVGWKEFQSRLPTKEELKSWFYQKSETNIAIVGGKVSTEQPAYFFALDIDDESVYERAATYYRKNTGNDLQSITPVIKSKDGYHIWAFSEQEAKSEDYTMFDVNSNVLSPCKGKDKKYVEVKGPGRIIVAPPSVHPDGHVYYFVQANPIPPIMTVPSLDSFLKELGFLVVPVEKLTTTVEKANGWVEVASDHWVSELLKGVPEGSRGNSCIRLAGYLKNKHPEDVTLSLLLPWGQRCTPPMDEREIRDCVKSAYTYPKSGEQTQNELEIISAEEIFNQPVQTVKGLWGDFIFPESIHLLSGEPGVSKTTFLYNLAISATVGGEFLGIPFDRSIRTMYLDLETPKSLQQKKLHLITEQAPKGLYFIPSIHLENDLTKLANRLLDKGIDLVIADTINEAFHTEREEDNAEANKQMHLVRQLVQQCGCAVILVHHIGKNASSKNIFKARGASARIASADVVLNLISTRQTDTVQLEVVKNRWVGKVEKLFILKAGNDKFERTNSVVEVEETMLTSERAKKMVKSHLKEHGQSQRKDIVDVLEQEGISQSSTGRAIETLVEEGAVINPKWGMYKLAND